MYQVLLALLQPYPLILLALGVSLAHVWRRAPEQRRRFRWVWIAYGLLVLSSLPIVSYYAAGMLEWQFPRTETRPTETRVIVVLGGGVIPARVPDARARLSESSLYRTQFAAELYRKGPHCTVLVSGGNFDPTQSVTPPAELMAELLRRDGVNPDDIIVERRSRNTEENANFSTQILNERGLNEGVVLVTTATHLVRAEHLFRRAGCKTTPIGCTHRSEECDEGVWAFWPKARAVVIQQEVFHEVLGMLWLMVRGRW